MKTNYSYLIEESARLIERVLTSFSHEIIDEITNELNSDSTMGVYVQVLPYPILNIELRNPKGKLTRYLQIDLTNKKEFH
jgi:hypothetical protein